jgi:hypothetical protein
VQVIRLSGFDPEGEPQVRVEPDGALCVVFSFMPPNDAAPEEDDLFEHFEAEMGKALGVKVLREDREVFRVPTPRDDTMAKLTTFVRTCRRGARRTAAAEGKKVLRQELLDALSEVLKPLGFRFRPGDEGGFSRTIPRGKQLVYVAWNHWGGQNWFAFGIEIRLDAVEDLVDPGNRELFTTVTQMEHFGLEADSPPQLGLGFRVSTPDEAAKVLERLRPILRDRVPSFLERYRDVVSVDQALHPEPEPSAAAAAPADAPRGGWLRSLFGRAPRPDAALAPEDPAAGLRRQRQAFDSNAQPHRAMTGLAVACLAHNPRFRDLSAAYIRQLSAMELMPQDRQRVDALLARLRALDAGAAPRAET